MALTRAALREMGVTEKEIIDNIMEAHGAGIEAAKEKAKDTAERAVQKTIDDLQAKVDSKQPGDGEDYKAKYEAEVEAHNATKTGYTEKETISAKRAAIRGEFVNLGMNESVFDDFIGDKLDYSKLELDGSKAKKPQDFIKPYQEQYARYFGKITTAGADVADPPAGSFGGGNAPTPLSQEVKALNAHRITN